MKEFPIYIRIDKDYYKVVSEEGYYKISLNDTTWQNHSCVTSKKYVDELLANEDATVIIAEQFMKIEDRYYEQKERTIETR